MSGYRVARLTDDLTMLRLDDDETAYFEALWEIPEGITYNSYVLSTKDGAVVFDTWKDRYSEQYLEALRKVVDPGKVRYIVVHHMEPDHSGCLPHLLKEAPEATVLGHQMVRDMMRHFYGIEPRFRPVGDGEELELGGRRMRFLHTPWLHWPETIMTYLEGILLSCDAFGGYSIPRSIFDDEEVEGYLPHVRKYIVSVIGAYRRFIEKNIAKLRSSGLRIEMIAPSHGLIWRRDSGRILDFYLEVAMGVPASRKAVVVYSSMYGMVEKLVRIAADELRRNGYSVIEAAFKDRERAAIADVISELSDAELAVFGTATYEAGVFPYFSYLLNLMSKKSSFRGPALVLTAHGWGPVAGKQVSEELRRSGVEVVDSIELRGSPTPVDETRIREAVRKAIEAASLKRKAGDS